MVKQSYCSQVRHEKKKRQIVLVIKQHQNIVKNNDNKLGMFSTIAK